MRLLSLEEAVVRVLAGVRRLPAERVSLAAALGRTSALEVRSPVDLPAFPTSTRDGYAVRAADTTGPLPTCLPCTDESAAGSATGAVLVPGRAHRIRTGAPVPHGADAVVPDEEVRAEGSTVRLLRPVEAGACVRTMGEDIRRGDCVIEAHRVLGPVDLARLASVGLAEVSVVRRPRVAVLSTGDELVRPGMPLPNGAVYASNAVLLAGLVLEAGGRCLDRGLVPDDLEATRAALRRCLSSDLVVTAGGSGSSDRDCLREALLEEGAVLHVRGVAMSPGRLAAFATLEGTRVLVLPGHPTACAVAFLQLGRPVLKAMLGDPHPTLPCLNAIAAEDIRKTRGRTLVDGAILRRTAEGAILAYRAGRRTPGGLGPLASAHGLCVLPAASTGVRAGEPVSVQILSWSFLEEGPR